MRYNALKKEATQIHKYRMFYKKRILKKISYKGSLYYNISCSLMNQTSRRRLDAKNKGEDE